MKVGLKINARQTKLQKSNEEEVEEYRYLGSIVNTEGGTEEDITRRIILARNALTC